MIHGDEQLLRGYQEMLKWQAKTITENLKQSYSKMNEIETITGNKVEKDEF